jgi:hypothetical protein
MRSRRGAPDGTTSRSRIPSPACAIDTSIINASRSRRSTISSRMAPSPTGDRCSLVSDGIPTARSGHASPSSWARGTSRRAALSGAPSLTRPGRADRPPGARRWRPAENRGNRRLTRTQERLPTACEPDGRAPTSHCCRARTSGRCPRRSKRGPRRPVHARRRPEPASCCRWRNEGRQRGVYRDGRGQSSAPRARFAAPWATTAQGRSASGLESGPGTRETAAPCNFSASPRHS